MLKDNQESKLGFGGLSMDASDSPQATVSVLIHTSAVSVCGTSSG